MPKLTKRQKKLEGIVDKSKVYELKGASALVKKTASTKFDETVDLSIHLGVNPKELTQGVRGTVPLPHGTGKKVRVCVFCKSEKAKEAQAAGAEFVGSEELIEKVKGGWCEFDVAIATPDMMRLIGALGRVLGPRGLMPNPKAGTVTLDVTKAINEVKAGRIEFKMDKQGNINVPIAKASFSEEAIYENATTLLEALMQAKPSGAKGHFIKSISMSTSMGPGIRTNYTIAKKA
ncbi:MAG: 50S ribosomal protein L1 [Candidatus Omnitrophica bacterium CG07_land_8_20_14_0_80_42_15]|uniref:Large ribosomal subunit protein uL1 n=1 Tax=Candidatus Aquitaenariimonas noxiae TaxID=1974741 RepID=A0A2J0KWJ4_9BACT|nr:MAG: 50S ribosomal protein L1 [Candidatus Omnitrophica bacterium CG07_land_8_20_14_0_80_42_15]